MPANETESGAIPLHRLVQDTGRERQLALRLRAVAALITRSRRFAVEWSAGARGMRIITSATAAPIILARSTLNAWEHHGWVHSDHEGGTHVEYRLTDAGLEAVRNAA